MPNYEIECEALVDAIQVLVAVPHKVGILTSEFVKFTKRKAGFSITLTGDIHAYQQLDAQGDWPFSKASIYVDRRVLQTFVASGKATNKPFILSEAKLGPSIRQGRRRTTFAVYGGTLAGYGTRPDLSNATKIVPDEASIESLSVLSSACSIEPSSPHLHHIVISKKVGFATNRVVAARRLIDLPDCVFPPTLVPFLRPDSAFYYYEDGTTSYVSLAIGKGEITQYLPQLDQNFPLKDLKRVVEDAISKFKGKPVVVRTSALSEVLGRLAGYYVGGKPFLDYVTIPDKGCVKLELRANDNNIRYTEVIKASNVVSPSLTVILSRDIAFEPLWRMVRGSATDETEILAGGKGSMLVVRNSEHTFVVSPFVV